MVGRLYRSAGAKAAATKYRCQPQQSHETQHTHNPHTISRTMPRGTVSNLPPRPTATGVAYKNKVTRRRAFVRYLFQCTPADAASLNGQSKEKHNLCESSEGGLPVCGWRFRWYASCVGQRSAHDLPNRKRRKQVGGRRETRQEMKSDGDGQRRKGSKSRRRGECKYREH